MPRDRISRSQRLLRHRRIRRKLKGSDRRPRLVVFRSLNHIYGQIIDDSRGVTLAAASSLEGEVRAQGDSKPKSEVAAIVGSLIARRALAEGISEVVFDRGGYKYHGRTRAVADAAREGGLTL